jgi:hypothetical protein
MPNSERKFEELNEEHPDSGFEELIRIMITEETGYACEKRNILGRSGNHYEVDGTRMGALLNPPTVSG